MIDQSTLEQLYAPASQPKPKAKVFTREGWATVTRGNDLPEVGHWTRSASGRRAYVDSPEVLAYVVYP